MNEDAFARRFYADRAELDSLGIALTVDRPADGVAEQENYSLRPENFHLPAIAFTDAELAALQTALLAARRRVRLRRAAAPRAPADLLGPPEPAARARAAGRSRSASPRSAGGHELSAAPGEDRDGDLPPQDDHVRLLHDGARRGRARARSTRTTCSSRAASSTCSAARTSATRCASSGCRASAARSPTRPRPSTTSSARRTSTRASYANRAAWQFGDPVGTAEMRVSERIAWQVERHFGRFGDDRTRTTTARSSSAPSTPTLRQLAAWVLALGEHARVARARRSSSTRSPSASRRWSRATSGALEVADAGRGGPPRERRRRRPPRRRARREAGDPPGALRPAGHAGVDPDRGRARAGAAARRRRGLRAPADLRAELREDVNVLNVVNFGGGSYVLYAEVHDDGDDRGRPRALLRQLRAARAAAAGRGQGARRRDRPHRRAPPRGLAGLRAREDRRRARRGPDGRRACRSRRRAATTRRSPASSRARSPSRRLLRLEYYKPNEDEFSERTVEPYALINGREGWYVASFDPAARRRAPLPPGPHQDRRGDRRALRRRAPRSTRPPTSTAGRAPARSRPRALARVWISPERARWAREERARRRRSWPTARSSSSCRSRAPTGSCARCSRRPATPSSSSPTDAREAVPSRPPAALARARRADAAALTASTSAPRLPMSRRDQIHDDRRRGRRLPRRGAHGDLRDQRPATAGRT